MGSRQAFQLSNLIDIADRISFCWWPVDDCQTVVVIEYRMMDYVIRYIPRQIVSENVLSAEAVPRCTCP